MIKKVPILRLLPKDSLFFCWLCVIFFFSHTYFILPRKMQDIKYYLANNYAKLVFDCDK